MTSAGWRAPTGCLGNYWRLQDDWTLLSCWYLCTRASGSRDKKANSNVALSLTKTMRRDWDARARKNAFHYIASWQKEWDLESFLASGEDDVSRFVVPVLSRRGVATAGKRML